MRVTRANRYKLAAAGVSALIVAAVTTGCSKPTPPVPATSETAQTAESDPLGKLLKLVGEDDLDAAIDWFVNDAPENWVESTSLQEFKMSESDFSRLSWGSKHELQLKFIDRVGEIKGFSRAVLARASEVKKQGDDETARKYVQAINQFGEQLRGADTVLVFQHLGASLANATTQE